MGYKQPDEAAIFNAARKIAEPESRAGYLKQACGEDPALLERVGALLRVHDEKKSFLESPPPGLAANTDAPAIREGPGTVIGPYKLHEPAPPAAGPRCLPGLSREAARPDGIGRKLSRRVCRRTVAPRKCRGAAIRTMPCGLGRAATAAGDVFHGTYPNFVDGGPRPLGA